MMPVIEINRQTCFIAGVHRRERDLCFCFKFMMLLPVSEEGSSLILTEFVAI